MTGRWRRQDVDNPIRCQHATDPVLRPHCTVTTTVGIGPFPLLVLPQPPLERR